MMPAQKNAPIASAISVGDLMGMILTRWWVIAFFITTCLGTAWYISKIIPPTYEAITVIEVRTKNRQILGNDIESDELRVSEAVATVATKLRNPRLIREIIDLPEIQTVKGFYKPTEGQEVGDSITDRKDSDEVKLQHLISSWISVETQKNTNLVNILVNHHTPQVTSIISDALAEAYIKADNLLKTDGVGGASSAVKEEMTLAATDQDEAQRRLQVYKAPIEIRSLLEEKRSELERLRQRYKMKWPARAAAESIYSDLVVRFANAVEFAAKDPAEAQYWKDIPAPKLSEPNPATSKELETWAFFAQQRLKARESLLEGQIQNLSNRYEALSKRLLEIDVSAKGDETADVTIAQYAIPPDPRFPSSPNKKMILGIGGVAGLGIGCSLALLLGLANNKVTDVSTAEAITGLPVLATLQHASEFKRKKGWHSVVNDHPHTVHAESFRNLRASIELLEKDRDIRIIAISSAKPGDGKTTVAADLAVCCALKWEKVLLIDCDLRKATLSTFFDIPEGHPGLTDYLRGDHPLLGAIVETPFDGLDMLASGTPTDMPSELMNEVNLQGLMTELLEQYDKVIIDTAPLLPVRDTLILSNFIDALALVVRAGETTEKNLKDVTKLFQKHDLQIDGLIMNNLRFKNADESYYSSQYYGRD